MDRIFESNRRYTEEEISNYATPLTHQGECLIADTPETEYWFVRDGHFWKLDHTWGHFILTKEEVSQ